VTVVYSTTVFFFNDQTSDTTYHTNLGKSITSIKENNIGEKEKWSINSIQIPNYLGHVSVVI